MKKLLPTTPKKTWMRSLQTIGFSSFLLASAPALNAQTMWAKNGNDLASFSATAPETILSMGTVTGIAAGESLMGIDFRPSTGEMYGIGYNGTSGVSQLYKINTTTLAAMPVGATFTIQMAATDLGFDFNPTVDRIRITTKEGANYRVHPDTGILLFTDGTLAYNASDANDGTMPAIGSVAYTNSYIGSTATALYDIDDALGILVLQSPPNAGGLATIGETGIMGAAGATSEIDIYWNATMLMNEARVATETASGVALYTLNLSSGTATLVGNIGSWTNVDDLISAIDFTVPATVSGQLVYALNSTGYLISFDSGMPATVRTQKSISGITAGQVLSGLDFRPATGQLYALGYNAVSGDAQLYTLNPATGSATAVAAVVTLATGMTHISFDFNPTVDRIRVTSSNGNNYRLHPLTGAIVATDGTLAFGASDVNAAETPMIIAGAYTNNYIGATATGLYGYNGSTNSITFQNPPNAGTLLTQGSSGIMINPADPTVDFDFYFDAATLMNQFYMVANTGTSNFDELYTVNVTNGTTQAVGMIGNGIAVLDMAVLTTPLMPAQISGQLVYGLSSNNNLITFDSENPVVVRSQIAITGLAAGLVLAGMDVRPATGELYAIGYNPVTGDVQIYTLNPMNGSLSAVGTAAQIETGITSVGFDFNPTVDRIRVTGSNGSNYRFNPTTGAIAFTDGNLVFATGDANAAATPQIGTVAYTNSYGGSNVTALYNYDNALNVFTSQVPPNNGTLNTIGNSGIVLNNLDKTADMDIYYDHVTHLNKALFVANEITNDKLYTVNLATGATEEIGLVGLGIALRNIAVRIDSLTTMTSTTSTLTVSSCGDYTSPNGSVYDLTGTYTNVIPNQAMYDSLITINLTINPAVTAMLTTVNDTSLTAMPEGLTYQWYDCATNMIIAGETDQTWSPASGNYAVIVTSTLGCMDTTACLLFEQTAALDEIGGTVFSVYPNPVSEELTIDFANLPTGTLKIVDQSGRIVQEATANATQITLHVSNLENGIYLLEMNGAVVRFVKQ